MSKLRVFLAEDYPFFRKMMRQILTADPEVDVVGESEDSTAIVLTVQSLAPDVVLLDTSLPGASGLEVASAIRRQSPRVQVVLLGDEEMEDYHTVARERGIAAYLLKQNMEQELLQALRNIHGVDGAG
ncbi:MAG: response regulator transcription factor [Chloroflexi bacterium]|nr:response regulator transcription factor [Chloroflexota bacterium]